MNDERRARRIIRGWKGIEAYSGLGRTQTQDLIDRGLWPAPVKLSARAVGWWEDEIAEAQERLVARQHREGK